MASRHRQTVSSTQGVASDDGSTNELLMDLRSQNLSTSSLQESTGDESMFVNTTKTDIDKSQAFPPVKNSKHVGSRFRGLSKSAIKLLSQDDQTLSELLTVKVGESNIDVEETNLSLQTSPQELSNCATLNEHAVNEIHSFRIRELEQKLKEKEEELAMNDLRWKQKMKEQKESLENKFTKLVNDLETEISALRQRPDENSNDVVFPKHESTNKEREDEDLLNSRIASLTADEIARYSRQLLLNDGWGVSGQQKLLSSSVLGKSSFLTFISNERSLLEYLTFKCVCL